MWRSAAEYITNALVSKADARLPGTAPAAAAGSAASAAEPASRATEPSNASTGGSQQPTDQGAQDLAPFSILSILSSIRRGDQQPFGGTAASSAISTSKAISHGTGNASQSNAAHADASPSHSSMPSATASASTASSEGCLASSTGNAPAASPPASISSTGSVGKQPLSQTNTILDLLYRLNAMPSTSGSQQSQPASGSSPSSEEQPGGRDAPDTAHESTAVAPAASISSGDDQQQASASTSSSGSQASEGTHTSSAIAQQPTIRLHTHRDYRTSDSRNISSQPGGSGASDGSSKPAEPQLSTSSPQKEQPQVEQSSSSVADQLLHSSLGDKPCRACTSTQDLFAAFNSQFGRRRASSTTAGNASSSNGTAGSGNGTTAAPATAAAGDTPATPAPAAAGDAPAAAASTNAAGLAGAGNSQPHFWEAEEEMPCPPDITELGRATWTFLHSAAAYYPEHPTPEQQAHMQALLAALGELYPCPDCAQHLRKELARRTPDVADSQRLSAWMCELHNEVNVRLGKEAFDCSKVFERWRDGPADGACGGPPLEH